MDLLDCDKTTVCRNLKKYKEFSLEALLQEARGGRHREYMTYEEELVLLGRIPLGSPKELILLILPKPASSWYIKRTFL